MSASDRSPHPLSRPLAVLLLGVILGVPAAVVDAGSSGGLLLADTVLLAAAVGCLVFAFVDVVRSARR